MTPRKRWRFIDGLVLAGLVSLSIAAGFSIWADIFFVGIDDEEQSHVLLAPFVVLWLAWLRRDRLRYVGPDWSLVGPITVAGGWALIEFGVAGTYIVFEQLGAITLVVGAVLTVTGPRLATMLYPSLCACLFLLHVPGFLRSAIAQPLQESSAVIAEWTLGALQFPITRQGNELIVNGVPVAIAEACNGMRMVSALALVSFAFVFSVPMRNSVRIVILATSPLVALAVNVARLIPTTLMYGYASDHNADLFHDVSGWGALIFALVALWALLATLRWLEVPIHPIKVARA